MQPAIFIFNTKQNKTFMILYKLKDILVNDGLITNQHLKNALIEIDKTNKSLSQILIKLNYVTKEQLYNFISDKIHIPYINLNNYKIDQNVLKYIKKETACLYNIIPLFEIENFLTIAMSDPLDKIIINKIIKKNKMENEPVLSSETDIKIAIEYWYGK